MPRTEALLENARQHLYSGMLVLHESKEVLGKWTPQILEGLIVRHDQLFRNQADFASLTRQDLKSRIIAIFRTEKDILEHLRDCKIFDINVQSASQFAKAQETKNSLPSSPPTASNSTEDPFDDQIGVPCQPLEGLNNDGTLSFYYLSDPESFASLTTSSDSNTPLRRTAVDSHSNASEDKGSDENMMAAGPVSASSSHARLLVFSGRQLEGESVMHCQVQDSSNTELDALTSQLQ